VKKGASALALKSEEKGNGVNEAENLWMTLQRKRGRKA